MKKYLLHLSIGTLLLVPLYGYAAEEVISTQIGSSTKESLVEGTTPTSIDTTSTPENSFTLCSQQAIEARDTAIAISRTTYNTAMAKALTERKNREKAAVAIKNDDAKKAAIKLSVDTYKNQSKKAQNTLTQARKIAWQTFEDAIQLCHDVEDAALNPQGETPDNFSGARKMEEPEQKSIGDVIKAQFENFKSLFN